MQPGAEARGRGHGDSRSLGDGTMVSREQKRSILKERLQVLRNATHSHAGNEMSIIADATTYIKDLKQKIARLNQEIASTPNTGDSPLVSVEALEKGFLIDVFVDTSSPGLLASIFEAANELGLTVLEARASCAGLFRLEAVGGEDEDEGLIDAHAVESCM